MTSESSDGDGSTSDFKALIREEIADQPDASIVRMWESDEYGIYVVVERPDSENQPYQTLYRVTLEPMLDGGHQLNWDWMGLHNEE